MIPIVQNSVWRDWRGTKGGAERWGKGWRTCPWGRAAGERLFHLQRRLREVLITACTVHKGQPQRGQMLCLHIRPHRKDKWQQLQVALGGLWSQWNKLLYNESNQSLEQPPQRYSRIPITGSFQDAVRWSDRLSHPFFHKRLDLMMFWYPSQPLWLWLLVLGHQIT